MQNHEEHNAGIISTFINKDAMLKEVVFCIQIYIIKFVYILNTKKLVESIIVLA
jgi:hypothetical protein